MKRAAQKQKGAAASPRAAKILKSLRNARKNAVEIARLHRTSIVYMQDGKLVRERPRG
jgi:hypothetical protein